MEPMSLTQMKYWIVKPYEQYNYIKSNFFLWKEDLEQVDDVLFMGIRI